MNEQDTEEPALPARRRGSRLRLVTVLVLLGAALAGRMVMDRLPSRALLSHPPERDLNEIPAEVGQDVWTTWTSGSFNPLGRKRVNVESVKLRGAPALGIEVVEMLACNFREGAGTADFGMVGDYFEDGSHKRSGCHPVSNAFFLPGKVSQDWYFLAHLRTSKPGTYEFEGWEMRYREGSRRGSQIYTGLVTITVSN